ncbi:hypothetical protein AOLI_G00097240 [Acnodon oligacanthus]
MFIHCKPNAVPGVDVSEAVLRGAAGCQAPEKRTASSSTSRAQGSSSRRRLNVQEASPDFWSRLAGFHCSIQSPEL